tara:strand:- start:2385 stop:3455 length:1071 start_codon:yes stop_codon:yes gene_type:complete
VFLIRNVRMEDMPELLRMAKTVHSNNLPSNERSMEKIIERVETSFAGEAELDQRFFTFVLMDTAHGDGGRVAGTSAIIARRGTPDFPRLYLKVRRHQHFSSDLQSGQVQLTVQLCQDTVGVTEVGGLVLAPAYRANDMRLGSFLSKSRFGFIGQHPQLFMDDVVAEVMGVLTPDGRTKLWDHLGRRFINLSYEEADVFSRTSKEFITSLFPTGEIHTSLLPAAARKLIGAASDDAIPALRMLERMGFQHVDEVDPFDGGPYLKADRDEITLVKSSRLISLAGCKELTGEEGYVNVSRPGHFRCVRCAYELDGDALWIPSEAADRLEVAVGDELGFTRDVARVRADRESQASDSVST